MEVWQYILSFVIGFIASLSVAMVILYWQFKHSIAGYRLKKVEEATVALINEVKSPNSYTGTFRNRYRYSLGVIIDRLLHTYGSNEIPKIENLHPTMIGKDGDGWGTFNLYVRPVIDDINAYSFIGGWVPFLPKVRKLRLLFKLCEQLENITAELDSIRLLSRTKNSDILNIEKEKVQITKTNDSSVNIQIDILINEFNNLETCWNNWLEIVEK